MGETLMIDDGALARPAALLKRFFDQYPALNLDEFYKDTISATENTQCVCCAKHIGLGDRCHDSRFIGESFGDSPFLKPPKQGRGVFCCDCKMAILQPNANMQFSYACVGVDRDNPARMKAYTVFGLEDFVAAVYKPLAPPLVFVKKERKKQHMIWKAQVNLHDIEQDDLLFFSFGDRHMSCSPKRVLALAQKEQELIEAAADFVSAQKKIKPLKELFFTAAMKQNLGAASFKIADYRHEMFGITEPTLLARMDDFVSAINSSCTGDRFLFAHLKVLAMLKKTKDYRAMVQALEPREVDMAAILSKKPNPTADDVANE